MSESELLDVKRTLRSLVVSSPTAMDAHMLLHDYRTMEGCTLPYVRFGYTDPIRFLRAKCTDCFLFHGPEHNPMLTLIVPKQLQHIDAFVQKQRISTSNRSNRFKMKRWSVQEKSVAVSAPRPSNDAGGARPAAPRSAPPLPSVRPPKPPLADDANNNNPYKVSEAGAGVQRQQEPVRHNRDSAGTAAGAGGWWRRHNHKPPATTPTQSAAMHDDNECTSSAAYSQHSDGARSELEMVRDDVAALVTRALRCEHVPDAYRTRYGRDLDVQRYGYNGIAAFVVSLVKHRSHIVRTCSAADGHLVLMPRDARDSDDDTIVPPSPRRLHVTTARGEGPGQGEEDALPGIDFEPDVYPWDCVHYRQPIHSVGVQWAVQQRAADVRVGEVYSPSHMWVQLLGEEHHIALETMMDDMTEYYKGPEGSARVLAPGAVMVGQHCAALYDGDWHRAVIVTAPDRNKRLKVRHVDYGTVDTVPASSLKPLLSKWVTLPTQAVRARLGGARPARGARRWSPAAATAFLHFIRDKQFVASILHVDEQESIVELLLVGTSTETDVRVDQQLVHAGYAEPCQAYMEGAVHHLPTFTALENGLTPNFTEICTYLRDGIDLDCVPEYRQHVPSLLPPPIRPLRQPHTHIATSTTPSPSGDVTVTQKRSCPTPTSVPTPPPTNTLSPLVAPFINRIELITARCSTPVPDDSVRCISPATSLYESSVTAASEHSAQSAADARGNEQWAIAPSQVGRQYLTQDGGSVTLTSNLTQTPMLTPSMAHSVDRSEAGRQYFAQDGKSVTLTSNLTQTPMLTPSMAHSVDRSEAGCQYFAQDGGSVALTSNLTQTPMLTPSMAHSVDRSEAGRQYFAQDGGSVASTSNLTQTPMLTPSVAHSVDRSEAGRQYFPMLTPSMAHSLDRSEAGRQYFGQDGGSVTLTSNLTQTPVLTPPMAHSLDRSEAGRQYFRQDEGGVTLTSNLSQTPMLTPSQTPTLMPPMAHSVDRSEAGRQYFAQYGGSVTLTSNLSQTPMLTPSQTPTLTPSMAHSWDCSEKGRQFFAQNGGSVTLSHNECQVYYLLLNVDLNAANWYIMTALQRAAAASPLPLPAPSPTPPS